MFNLQARPCRLPENILSSARSSPGAACPLLSLPGVADRIGLRIDISTMSAPIAVTLCRNHFELLSKTVSIQQASQRWTLEALVLEAIREGLISRGRGGELLGLWISRNREELWRSSEASITI